MRPYLIILGFSSPLILFLAVQGVCYVMKRKGISIEKEIGGSTAKW